MIKQWRTLTKRSDLTRTTLWPFMTEASLTRNKGDNDRAIADYNEAIRLDPKYALAFFSRGFIYANKGDTDRGMADFNETIRFNPMYAVAYYEPRLHL